MFVLHDNNSYVEPTHLMVTLAVVTLQCSMDDDPLLPLIYDDWSPNDDGCLMMDGW